MAEYIGSGDFEKVEEEVRGEGCGSEQVSLEEFEVGRAVNANAKVAGE